MTTKSPTAKLLSAFLAKLKAMPADERRALIERAAKKTAREMSQRSPTVWDQVPVGLTRPVLLEDPDDTQSNARPRGSGGIGDVTNVATVQCGPASQASSDFRFSTFATTHGRTATLHVTGYAAPDAGFGLSVRSHDGVGRPWPAANSDVEVTASGTPGPFDDSSAVVA